MANTHYDPHLQQRGTVRVTIEDGQTIRAFEVAIPRGGLAPLPSDHDLPFGGPHRRDRAEHLRNRNESVRMIQHAIGNALLGALEASDPVRGESPREIERPRELEWFPGKFDPDARPTKRSTLPGREQGKLYVRPDIAYACFQCNYPMTGPRETCAQCGRAHA